MLEPGPARERKERFRNWPEMAHMAPFALGSLGVQSVLRHCSYWEPWRSKLFTPSFVLGALAFKAFHVIVRNGALAFRAPRVTGPSGGGNLGVKAVSVTVPSWGPRAHTTVRTEEPWCEESVTS